MHYRSSALCQLHLSACQVAAGFDIDGGGGSIRSHFVKGFELSARSQAGRRPGGGGDSRARVAADAPAAAEKLQVQLRGEGGETECGAGRLAEMQWKQKGEERKED